MEPLIIALVGFGASFVKSAFGLGAGVLFAPALALFLEPRLAVGMTAPIMFLTSIASIGAHWGHWDWPLLRRLLPTAIVGLLLGSYFLAWAPAEYVRWAIGVAAIAFAAIQMWRLRQQDPAALPRRPPASAAGAMLYGICGGIVSGIAHSGGLFFSLYLLPRLNKVAFVASLTLTLLIIDSVRLLSYWRLSVLEVRHILWALLFFPLMFVGSRVGKALNGRLSERGFVVLLCILVAVTGLALLLR